MSDNDFNLDALTGLLPAGSAAWLRARPGSVRRIKVGPAYFYAFTTPEGDERTIAIDQVVGYEPSAALQSVTQPSAPLPSWGTVAGNVVEQQKHAAAIEAEEVERRAAGEAAQRQAQRENFKRTVDAQAAVQRGGE